jgi:hypothetical protein
MLHTRQQRSSTRAHAGWPQNYRKWRVQVLCAKALSSLHSDTIKIKQACTLNLSAQQQLSYKQISTAAPFPLPDTPVFLLLHVQVSRKSVHTS